jgi:hypothetical protein
MQQQSANGENQSQSTNPANSPAVPQQQPLQQQNPKGSVEGDRPKAKSLRDLFSLSDEGSIQENDDTSEDPNAPIDSLDRAIKKLGITADAAYKMKIPMPNGQEPVTLGMLKDRIGEVVDLERRELEFDTRRRDSEGELLRAQNEMRELMQLIPREQLKPELVERVRTQQNETMRRERQLTLQHIPEWRSEESRVADLEGMEELVEQYGFPKTFVSTVVDHRALKMLRDFYRMDKRIRAALADVKVPNSKGHKPSAKGSRPPENPRNSQPNTTRRNGVVPTERQRLESILNRSK